MIGNPIAITQPRISGLIPRYCQRSDDQPAAKIATSMLRLGISRSQDWSGSPVDFVAKGLARFCRKHGSEVISRVYPESYIRLMDEIIERGEYERSQSADIAPSTRMFLTISYEQASLVQIGPTLTYLSSFDAGLAVAFHQVFVSNLARCMHVYDFRDAEHFATEQMELRDEEELQESFFRDVKTTWPSDLKRLPKYGAAVKHLEKMLPQLKRSHAAKLVRLCLALHECGIVQRPSWPSGLRERVPEIEEYFENTDYPGLGSIVVFHEDDLIEACYTEEMQYLGQDYPIGAAAMWLIRLDQKTTAVDAEVQNAFDGLGNMLRTLSRAVELIEIARGIYDEDLRQRRLESRVPTEKSTAGVR